MLGITNVSNAPSIVLTNTSVSTWTALPSTGTDSDMKTQGYTYYASIPCSGISANTIAEVTFSDAQAKSGNYAPVCRTYANEIRVYSKVNTAITIPSIIVHSIVETYYELDNAPTSGSTKAVTSGGVYDACTKIETIVNDTTIKVIRCGKIVQVTIVNYNHGSSGDHVAKTGLPKSVNYVATTLVHNSNAFSGTAYINAGSTSLNINQTGNNLQYGTIVYICE